MRLLSHLFQIPDTHCAHLTVHEPLKFQLSNAKLAVLFGQTPAGLSKVDLSSPHYTHVLRRLPQLQFVCTLQLEVLKTPERKTGCFFFYFNLVPYLSPVLDANEW